ncbi:DNA polymerase IV [Leucobacter sp. M11]|uniref:DNA polymerase IV n=1 Tax=Leucobacter sp. M11 TaxID=2993565 RepID=UPI002D7F6CF4|nr:DNA polymerase IV [Leucobacter sp. M11]MEB4613211.1 DNA polymerase IV [Leucobacter sp. M11]
MTERPRSRPTVLHVDMDAFFASVELLERPELIGRPVAIAHDTGRSVVSSCTYEARRFGVRSAMPIQMAKQRCPQLIIIPPTMGKYSAYSKRVMAIFREFTPLVEPLSIDEAFLDVAGAERLFGPAPRIAELLRERVRQETGLPCSVGVAGTKFIAKLASQRAKPDGVLVIEPEHTLEFLHPLPVGAMWGVGPATQKSLESRGIRTVGDLATEPLPSLRNLVGQAAAQKLHDLANGRDARGVEIEHQEKSIGHEETFAHDVADPRVLDRELLRLSQAVGERLRKKGLRARTVAIKVRWSDFTTVTRSQTLSEPTDTSHRIVSTARSLLAQLDSAGQRVRLIGVRAEQLMDAEDALLGLWSDDDEQRVVDQTADGIRARFGSAGLRPARLITARDGVVDARSLRDPEA